MHSKRIVAAILVVLGSTAAGFSVRHLLRGTPSPAETAARMLASEPKTGAAAATPSPDPHRGPDLTDQPGADPDSGRAETGPNANAKSRPTDRAARRSNPASAPPASPRSVPDPAPPDRVRPVGKAVRPP